MVMETRELVCIGCPMGCNLEIELNNGEIVSVKGNTCKIGHEYGEKECTNPTRVITSSVRVSDGDIEMVPVKTSLDVPKDMIFDITKVLKDIIIEAPIKVGDIIVNNVLGTGANIVATRSVFKTNQVNCRI